MRAQVRTAAPPSSASVAAWGPPPPPTSLCHSMGGGINPTSPSVIPLSSLLSSSSSFRPFSPSTTLQYLLSSALLHSLEEVWLASFMAIPTSHAKRLSKAERAAQALTQPSLVYGEVTLTALAAIIWGLGLKSGGTFVDLGSGSGRGVVGALLLHDWDVVRGVELLEGLWKASVGVKEKVERERKGGVMGGVAGAAEGGEGEGVAVGGGRRTRVVMEKGNFFDVDWSDADVVLANSTCFDEGMMDRIARKGQKLQQGAYGQHHDGGGRRRGITAGRTPPLLCSHVTAGVAVCGQC